VNPFNIINPANPMNNNRIGQMKNMLDTFRNSKNPMALFQQMAQRNPQFQPVIKMMQQGMNPNQIFESVCKERGINPQEFLNMFKG
jgi:hypothetical protein